MMMTHLDFVLEFNYACNDAEPQDPEVLVELESLINDMMIATCGSAVPFEIYNNKGQIRLLGETNEEAKS